MAVYVCTSTPIQVKQSSDANSTKRLKWRTLESNVGVGTNIINHELRHRDLFIFHVGIRWSFYLSLVSVFPYAQP